MLLLYSKTVREGDTKVAVLTPTYHVSGDTLCKRSLLVVVLKTTRRQDITEKSSISDFCKNSVASMKNRAPLSPATTDAIESQESTFRNNITI